MIIPVKIGKMNLDPIIRVLTKCFIWSVYGFTFSEKLRPTTTKKTLSTALVHRNRGFCDRSNYRLVSILPLLSKHLNLDILKNIFETCQYSAFLFFYLQVMGTQSVMDGGINVIWILKSMSSSRGIWRGVVCVGVSTHPPPSKSPPLFLLKPPPLNLQTVKPP